MRGFRAYDTPTGRKMAAKKDADTQILGQYHPKCTKGVSFSKDRRIGSGDVSEFSIAFLNDPIPSGQKFSVKILQKSSFSVSPTRASSRPHPSDVPYTDGGAACSPLLSIHCAKWPLVTIACHCCLLPSTARDYRHARTVCGIGHSVARIRVRY